MRGSINERPTIEFDELKSGKHGCTFHNVYGQSKLADVLHARELANRHRGTGATAFAQQSD